MLAGLPQHPPSRFMNKIVLVAEQPSRDGKSILEVASVDECHTRHDRNPTLPQLGRFGETMQNPARSEDQMLPTIYGAEVSTKSQLLMHRVWLR
jgi:hypothetical protein